MADAAVNLEAADVLGLASNWLPQNSSIVTDQDYGPMTKADGDFARFSDVFNNRDAVTIPYRWNAVTGLGAALASLCGSVSNGYLITEISIESVYNDWPTINFTAHNHANNAHSGSSYPTYSPGTGMAALLTGAFGAYDLAAKGAADACIQRSTYRIFLNHVDAECSTGDHFVGTNIQGQEEISCQYVGLIATPTTLASWTVTSAEATDSNEEFDTSTITATRLLVRDP